MLWRVGKMLIKYKRSFMFFRKLCMFKMKNASFFRIIWSKSSLKGDVINLSHELKIKLDLLLHDHFYNFFFYFILCYSSVGYMSVTAELLGYGARTLIIGGAKINNIKNIYLYRRRLAMIPGSLSI